VSISYQITRLPRSPVFVVNIINNKNRLRRSPLIPNLTGAPGKAVELTFSAAGYKKYNQEHYKSYCDDASPHACLEYTAYYFTAA